MELEGFEINEGFPLITKNPNNYTNAIVYKIEGNDIFICSDFCNVVKHSEESLSLSYSVPEHYRETFVWGDDEYRKGIYSVERWLEDNLHATLKVAKEVGISIFTEELPPHGD